jgi:transcriptional regulator with XRE-family HTH domain
MAGRPRIEIRAEQRARELRSAVAGDIRRLLQDSGVSGARLAREAKVSPDTISLILRERREPSFDVLARIALAAGGDVTIRIVPGAGLAIHDRYQARMMEALLRDLHPRWAPYPKVAVRTPARGSIDLVLADTIDRGLVASEFESGLRRAEQTLRWANEMASALVDTELFAAACASGAGDGTGPAISRLLVLRSTPATRSAVAQLPALFEAAYPAGTERAVAALRDRSDWPGSAIAWMWVRGRTVRLMDGAQRELPRWGLL